MRQLLTEDIAQNSIQPTIRWHPRCKSLVSRAIDAFRPYLYDLFIKTENGITGHLDVDPILELTGGGVARD
jgi:hypothetical protein